MSQRTPRPTNPAARHIRPVDELDDTNVDPAPQPQVGMDKRWRWALIDDDGHLTILATGILAVLSTAVIAVVVWTVGPYVLHAARWVIRPDHTITPAAQLWHTIDNPVRTYLATRGAGLPASPGTLYWAWAVAGILILFRVLRGGANRGNQIAFVIWGSVSTGMVWAGTPIAGRPVAAGLAALLWALLAALTLTGHRVTTAVAVIREAPTWEPPASIVPRQRHAAATQEDDALI